MTKQPPNIPQSILDAAAKVTGKRAKIVIDHIIKNGFISTEDLLNQYGYSHAPRAARDVREEGIPLETFKVKDKHGKSIGAYRFGNPDDIEAHKLGGRKVFSKAFKNALILRYGSRCSISSEEYEEIYLQIDHRLPYQIAGESIGDERSPELFMLLSGAAQRQKSWSCEHCDNLLKIKNLDVCKGCYWAYPESYSHVAMKEERRIDIVFSGNEIAMYEEVKKRAESSGSTLQKIIKESLK